MLGLQRIGIAVDQNAPIQHHNYSLNGPMVYHDSNIVGNLCFVLCDTQSPYKLCECAPPDVTPCLCADVGKGLN